MNVITGRPAADWLTLTTFDEKEAGRLWELLFCLQNARDKVKPARQMQYQGVGTDTAFMGRGYQKDNQTGETLLSTMFRAWGSASHDTLAEIGNEPIATCTRIDLQITIPLPAEYKARRLKDKLDTAEWRGRRRKLKLYESDGLDTVEIGGRTSDRFIRIYVKQINGIHWLRFEVEYKDERAQKVYAVVCRGNTNVMGGILRAEIDALPEVADAGTWAIKEELYQSAVTVKPGDRQELDSSTYKWLSTQVDSCIQRMVNDHDEGQRTRALIQRWHDIVQDIDKTRTDAINLQASFDQAKRRKQDGLP